MTKCPYCNTSIRLEDFFEEKGILGMQFVFKGQEVRHGKILTREWSCPNCDKLLAISESNNIASI